MKTSEKENEYREIFLSEALEQYAEMNRLLTVLERDHQEHKAIESLFRVTHTLKGNASGMGYEKIAQLAHTLEDLFAAVRDRKISLTGELFTSVFKAADTLGELIESIRTPREVRYKGIKTKLEVLIRNSDQESPAPDEDVHGGILSETLASDEFDNSEAAAVVFSDTVHVPVKKLDALLDLVGELIIERDRIVAMAESRGTRNEYGRLTRISSDLQYSVMNVRLVQAEFVFSRFHRVVRDAAATESKEVRLQLEGTDTEIDRNVLQVMCDSMIHLIRNSIGHGIESPEARRAAGKPAEGTITLTASSESDTVVIRIKDDGRGIDPAFIRRKAIERKLISPQQADLLSERDSIMLIFQPGFSTTDEVNAISGRGVGMDVVKKAMESIGGTVQVDSMLGEGTIVTLRLPASMAVKSSLLFELDGQTCAIPLAYTESVLSVYRSDLHSAGGQLITTHLGAAISLVFLSSILRTTSGSATAPSEDLRNFHPEEKFQVVIVAYNGQRAGFIVDRLLQQKEIVEKPLQRPYDKVAALNGVTILGNGTVCLVLSVPGIFSMIRSKKSLKK